MDLYLRVRLACHVDGLSQREAASRFGIARETVRKMLRHSEPPGYRRRQPPKRPKLAPFTDIIDRILEEDRTVHRKQHHTAKRIFERLRDEHGFTGKETIVKDYVRERRLRRREMFVPLSHPPGHAQADFGEADAIIAGVKYRAHFFVMTLPHSDVLRCGLPGGDDGGLAGRAQQSLCFFRRVPQSLTTTSSGVAHLPDGTRPNVQSGLRPITSSRTATAVPARVTTKAMWRGWSAMPGLQRRFPGSRLGRLQWPTWKSNGRNRTLRGHCESIGERFVLTAKR